MYQISNRYIRLINKPRISVCLILKYGSNAIIKNIRIIIMLQQINQRNCFIVHLSLFCVQKYGCAYRVIYSTMNFFGNTMFDIPYMLVLLTHLQSCLVNLAYHYCVHYCSKMCLQWMYYFEIDAGA